MSTLDSFYSEMKKVEAILNGGQTTYFAKLVSGLSALYPIDQTMPFLKNKYTIADTYAYCHSVISSLLVVSHAIPREQLRIECGDLIACYRNIALRYHHVPTNIFDKVFENRTTLYKEQLTKTNNFEKNLLIASNTFRDIIRFDTLADEFYDVSSGEVPAVISDVSDIKESFLLEVKIKAGLLSYMDVISKAAKTGIDNCYSSSGASKRSYGKNVENKSKKPLFVFLAIAAVILLIIFSGGK